MGQDALLQRTPGLAVGSAVDVPAVENRDDVVLRGDQHELATVSVACEHTGNPVVVIRHPPLVSVAGIGPPIVG